MQIHQSILVPLNPVTGERELKGIYIITHTSQRIEGCLRKIQGCNLLAGDFTGKRSRKVVIDGLSCSELICALDELLVGALNGAYKGPIIKEIAEKLVELEEIGMVVKTGKYIVYTDGISYFNIYRQRSEQHNGIQVIPKYEIDYHSILRILFGGNQYIQKILDLLSTDQKIMLYQLGYNSVDNEGIYPDVIGRQLYNLAQNILGEKRINDSMIQKIISGEIGNGVNFSNKYTIPYIE